MDLDAISSSLDYTGEEFEVVVDGNTLKGQKWVPKGEIRFKYVFVHGFSVFCTFYLDVFKVMNSIGAAVYACDHYGHGKSSGYRGSGTIDINVDGLEQVVIFAAQDGDYVPIFIHGHSMGGLVTLMLSLKKRQLIQTHISGIITENPWLSFHPRKAPGCCLNSLIKAIYYVAPNLTFPVGVDDCSPDQNPEWNHNLVNSPLFYPKISPKLYISVIESQNYIRSQKLHWNNDIPYLFLQGGRDMLVSPSENSYFFRYLARKRNIEFKYYENNSHVLLKTPMRKKILEEMICFINKNINI